MPFVGARGVRVPSRILIGLPAATVVTALFVSGLPGGPGAFRAFAQSTTPTIKLMNPDATTSAEISAKDDTEDTTYHLAAWISNPPPSPTVQFSYQPEDGVEQDIVCADTGSPDATPVTADTYDCDWSLAGIEDGGGTLRAKLYSGVSKVVEDAEEVTIDATGQTVEIVRPRHGEQAAFQTASDGTVGTTIDVRTSGPGTPEGDEGTQRVTVYYSISPPGVEPAFEECGSKDTTGGTQDTVTCTMADDDPATPQKENDPARVTAIAATAGDTDEGPEPGVCTEPDVLLCDQEDLDAADAHRVFVAGATPTPTETGIQTPTQSPSTTAALPSERDVTFDVDRPRVVAGGRIVLSGRIFSENEGCTDAQEFVRIRRRNHGTDRYRNFAGLNTDGEGAFTLATRVKRSADYVARAPAHDDCERASSTPVSVLVKVKMQIAVSDVTPRKGQLIEIKSSVRPQHDGTRLVLQRKKGRRWVRFMSTDLNRRSIGGFVVRAGFRSRTFRTKWVSQSSANASNVSRMVRVRTH